MKFGIGNGVFRAVALPVACLALVMAPAVADNRLPHPKPLQTPAIPVPQAAPPAPANAAGGSTPFMSVKLSRPARDYFGKVKKPAHSASQAIGSYAKGCQAGAEPLPANGPGFQVMRLSRNRFWGQPVLIDYIEDLGRDVPGLGWRGLMIGDMAQPRGGPMPSGHASHQIGLDVDIWLKQMPDHIMNAKEREDVSAVSMLRGPLNVKGADRTVDPKKFTALQARLIRRAAQDPRVARIFVSPGIKKALCAFETGERSWLRVIRPWWGHHYHFHVRLKCPADDRNCKNQAPPPPGDGCGKALSWWMSDEPWVPKPGAKPGKPKPPMTMAALPRQCIAVLKSR